ncbi:MAG: AFG1 family ATPase [Alphaproteobacteria bacterium]|nr:AFG1 family ATPase [Alphaproteobacteria bacterium]
MSVALAYQAKLAAGEVTRDPAQEDAAKAMDAFLARWQNRNADEPQNILSLLKRKQKRKATTRGLYMYGGVGRGKTMLMDMLVREVKGPKTRRVHFHAFMLEIHARLKKLRDTGGDVDDYLGDVAKEIAAETDLLCFDELHVNDIADAMILGPLFEKLMQGGVAVVATSNYAPQDLYKDGLQRSRFLPFIDFLKAHMDVVYLDSPNDYRLRALSERGTWFYPLGDQSWGQMDTLFEALTGSAGTTSAALDVGGGRSLPVVRTDGHRAWLEFDVLCREARGAVDYLALCEAYLAVFVDNVPRMGEENRNELRRFMTLVDTLYDAGKVLVVRAATTPDKLYDGNTHGFEFQRTLSRLLEMQSPDWLAKKLK